MKCTPCLRRYIEAVMRGKRASAADRVTAFVLRIMSGAYCAVTMALRFYRTRVQRPRDPGIPVISVGNITVGGTGKTPCALWCARHLTANGIPASVIARGYGNDEAALLRGSSGFHSVYIGPDRFKKASEAAQSGARAVVLDDGFQHYSITRTLDIVLIDATTFPAEDHIVPAGTLREPVRRLSDADIIIVTKSDMDGANVTELETLVRRVNADAPVYTSVYTPVCLRRVISEDAMPVSHLASRRVVTVSGIGNPHYFDWMVARAGAEIVERCHFPDHYAFAQRDIARVSEACVRHSAALVLTTAKDAVRLKRKDLAGLPVPVWLLEVTFCLTSGNEELRARLITACSG